MVAGDTNAVGAPQVAVPDTEQTGVDSLEAGGSTITISQALCPASPPSENELLFQGDVPPGCLDPPPKENAPYYECVVVRRSLRALTQFR